MISSTAILWILAACTPFSELCSAALLQIGVSFGLWSFISFGFFWVVDVLDSVRLNRGGKVHLESGVCGCRVGFNGERIHFGSSGCRSVGGNKNRGIIDYSFDHALSMTIEFAQEIHDLAPGLMRDFVCTVCSGVRNIVRVSLGLSIVSLAYLAVKLIEMCAFFSRILHALDKCPVLSCTLLGAIAEYFGKEKHASIVGGIVLLKYPLHVIYILYFSLCLGRVILKRTLIQWPLALPMLVIHLSAHTLQFLHFQFFCRNAEFHEFRISCA